MKKLETIRQLALDVRTGKKSVASLRRTELELLLKFDFPLREWAKQQTFDKPIER